MNNKPNKGKYVLAALAGAAAGGATVALATRTVPKMMSGMMAKCEKMMAGMATAKSGAGNMCPCTMVGTEQATEHADCGSAPNA